MAQRTPLDSLLLAHVSLVTVGYLLTCSIGMLGAVLRAAAHGHGICASASKSPWMRALWRLSVVAFALTFFGTVLGGIWANRQWGSFWNWDLKEIGALATVIWQVHLVVVSVAPGRQDALVGLLGCSWRRDRHVRLVCGEGFWQPRTSACIRPRKLPHRHCLLGHANHASARHRWSLLQADGCVCGSWRSERRAAHVVSGLAVSRLIDPLYCVRGSFNVAPFACVTNKNLIVTSHAFARAASARRRMFSNALNGENRRSPRALTYTLDALVSEPMHQRLGAWVRINSALPWLEQSADAPIELEERLRRRPANRVRRAPATNPRERGDTGHRFLAALNILPSGSARPVPGCRGYLEFPAESREGRPNRVEIRDERRAVRR